MPTISYESKENFRISATEDGRFIITLNDGETIEASSAAALVRCINGLGKAILIPVGNDRTVTIAGSHGGQVRGGQNTNDVFLGGGNPGGAGQ